MNRLLRLYEPHELGKDGYPVSWHKSTEFVNWAGPKIANSYESFLLPPIKNLVREQASHRCQRCKHPYRKGENGSGEWSPCDEHCTHGTPIRYRWAPSVPWSVEEHVAEGWRNAVAGAEVEAHWRILTVHHLNGDKTDCRWWNLAALCQRCHLTIQGRVVMERAFILEHSEWFKPYAAGWYASKYLGEEITREEAENRMDELLSLERLT